MKVSALAPSRWLSTTIPVDRSSYLASGLVLMLAKYILEALIVFVSCGVLWSPWVFLSPLASVRSEALSNVPPDLSVFILSVLAVLSIPFLAIGLSMSIRRAADAGIPPWVGLAFAAPVLNYLTMVLLAAAPSRPVFAGPRAPDSKVDHGAARAALVGICAAVVMGVAVVFVASQQLALYGATIFFLLPISMGAITGYIVNREHVRSVRLTLGAALAAAAVTCGAMLLFALEGLICLIIAAPIASVAVVIGALLGRGIVQMATARPSSGAGPTLACIALLPGVASLERAVTTPITYEVRSSIEVHASPTHVWKRVISFPDLPEANEWYFHTGIAVPLRARIEGHGVGAVRYCEFSTGAFIEPITHWEPGHRLAFDVSAQPPPMEEWSPYRKLHPPHLDASITSRRGEFRLHALANGRTRLEGSTWYSLSLGPDFYFRLWSDAIIHRIHLRVLSHVARLAEADQALPAT